MPRAGDCRPHQPVLMRPGRAPRRAAATAIAGLFAASLTACTAPATLPDGVTVSLVQYRADYGARRMQLTLHNGSAVAVVIDTMSLSSPAYEGSMPLQKQRERTLRPGATVDLPVTLAAPLCPQGRATASARPADARVRIDGRIGDAPLRAELTPSDPEGWLAKAHRADCIDEEVSDAVSITVGGIRVDHEGARTTARLRVSATPKPGGEAIRIVGVDRTILLRPSDGNADGWPLDWNIDDSAPGESTELDIVPSNCNPHVLAEDKRGTFWPLRVVFSDGTSEVSFVASPDEVRDGLYRFVAEYCGF